MSIYSAECLEVQEAVEAAQGLVDEMLAEESAYYNGLEDSSGQYLRNTLWKDYRDRYPETPAVRYETYDKYLTRAALLGAGVSDPDDVPQALIETIELNRSALWGDTLDVLTKRPESLPKGVTGFSIGSLLLTSEDYLELFAHQYEVIGKLSLTELVEGEAR